MSEYDAQSRGTREAYERYLRGMDASMRQKVAITAAHLLGRGRVADMGMGSGAGSHALAALYPEMEVVGVDVDPAMVTMARERFRLPNLRFEVGDVAAPVFPEGSLDGILDSSVLHHVTSFGGYDRAAAARALEVQARELAPHGVLVVRDFVDPGPGDVLLDVRVDDGEETDDPRRASTAALLERFSREHRSLADRPGFPLERVAGAPPGFRRHRLSWTHAAEFVLRKDYRTDWEAEAKEEYTYLTQAGFEEVFARLGLRVLASTPIRSPWIVRNRFAGKIQLRDVEGAPLEHPATNYLIAGEKVGEGEGVAFREVGPAAPLGFLELGCFVEKRSGHVRDLVRRPHATIDVVPHFAFRGDRFVLVRASYPRPVLRADREAPPIDGASPPAYVTEPLNVVQRDKPIGQTVEEALAEVAGIAPRSILGFSPGTTYYPSPGGLQEEVRSVFVEIEPTFVEERIANVSGFSTSGRVRAIEAEQVLRAAQVGALPDARVELNVYALLLRLGVEIGPWIGETIELRDGEPPRATTTMKALAERKPRRAFERVPVERASGFLELRCTTFEEVDSRGHAVARAPLELVVPKRLSSTTIATALLRRSGDRIFLGIDVDDLPAAQSFVGNSDLLVTPAFRLPRDVRSITPARAWVRERLAAEYDVETGDAWELGGRYHPSPGVTPEVVHAVAFEVTREGGGGRPLAWVDVADLIDRIGDVTDGHLRVISLRCAHALGLFAARGANGSRAERTPCT